MRARGFTLIEVLIVVGLVVVLASVAMPLYRNAMRRSDEAVLKEDLFRMRDTLEQYYADRQKSPASLQALVSEGSRREVPTDPIKNAADTWMTIPAEPDASNP